MSRWSAPRLWQVATMLERGATDAEVGARFGVTYSAVYYQRQRHDLRRGRAYFLSAAECGRLLSITEHRVGKLCASGELKARRLGRSAQWLIKREDAEAWHALDLIRYREAGTLLCLTACAARLLLAREGVRHYGARPQYVRRADVLRLRQERLGW